MSKVVGKIVIVLGVLVVCGAVFKNSLIATAVAVGVKAATGASLSFEKFDIDLIGSRIDIKGLIVRSPDGFHGEPMIDIPTVYLDFRLMPIFSGKIIIDDFRFELKEITVVRNEKGVTNFDVISGKCDKDGELKKQKGNKGKPRVESKATGGDSRSKTDRKQPAITIGDLYLKADKMTFKDYQMKDRNGATPTITDFSFFIEEKAKDITDVHAYGAMITKKIIAKTTLGNTLSFSDKLIDETTGATKGLIDIGGDAVKGTTGVVAGTTKALFGIFDKK